MNLETTVRDRRLDALRGLLLLIMAAVHVPTPLSRAFQEPFGYTSAAEGFVFLSAYLAGSVYGEMCRQKDWATMARRVWTRTRLVYLVHLGLLVPTALLAWATAGQVVALTNHFHVFLAHPVESLALMPLLLHQPPLFDILPLYVILLGTTPWLLAWANRYGWRGLVIISSFGWLVAQGHFHLGSGVSGLLPFQPGSFHLLAWQFLWVCGLALGEVSLRGPILPPTCRVPLGVVASAIVLAGLLSRHGLWPDAWFNPDLYRCMDKWTLGPLRLLNFSSWVVVLMAWKPRLPNSFLSPTALLGRHSLAVFSIHLLLTVAATAAIQSLAFSPVAQTFVGLGVMAVLFPWAAWQERRMARPALTSTIPIDVAVPNGIHQAPTAWPQAPADIDALLRGKTVV